VRNILIFMSRIGKKPILIPEGVEVAVDKGRVSIKGPQGELNRVFKNNIDIVIKDGAVVLTPVKETKENSALWGTYASHIKNMIEGVKNGFEKKLIIEGIGFRAAVEGTNLVLNLGLSHPVKMEIPGGLKVATEKGLIIISGPDKEKVGKFSAEVRDLKRPEPYKGKGIRYEKEIIRRKAGKKAVATTT
jgi:large subunit ribosomal protein L6